MLEPISVGVHDADPVRPAQATLARAAPDRERLARRARETDAGRQLLRCFPRWTTALDHLRWAALARLARNEPVDPNDPDTWAGRDQHAHAILRRHGITGVAPTRLTLQAIGRLIDAQASADRDAGLEWTRITTPAHALDTALRRAHARLGIDLDDPAVWTRRADQRAALARRLGLSDEQSDDVSRWALEHRRVRRRRPALLADRLGHVAAARRPAATGGGPRRAARRRLRRAGRWRAGGGSSCRHSRSMRSAWSPRSAARSAATSPRQRCRPRPRMSCLCASTTTPCTRGRRNAWTRPPSSHRSSRAPSASR